MKDPPAGSRAGPRAGRGGRAAVLNHPDPGHLTDRRFSDPGWAFEPKLDGERRLGFGKSRRRGCCPATANGSTTLPELAEALAAQEADDFVAEGEVVAFEGGRSSFARL